LEKLSNTIGRNKIIWRYDPILLTEKYTVERHMETFEYLAERISPLVYRCIFSFVDMYKKVEDNMPEIIPLTDDDKKRLLKIFLYICLFIYSFSYIFLLDYE
jgi:hypothetical protein